MLKAGHVVHDRYVLSRQLGCSEAGETWAGTDTSDGRQVALKFLSFSSVAKWDELELFRREIALLKSVDFPSIPAYVDDFTIEGPEGSFLVLVQRYVGGDNLEEMVRSGRRFSLEEVHTLTVQLLETLRYLHALRPPVIHRDLHPRNIVLDRAGNAHLVDFGAAGALINASVPEEAALVSPEALGYAAPEQLAGTATPASDLYALGMTVVFLLSGKNPADFDSQDMRRAYRRLAAKDRKLVSLLDGLCQSLVERRIPTAERALKVLGAGRASAHRLGSSS